MKLKGEQISGKNKYEDLSKIELIIEFSILVLISKLNPVLFTRKYLGDYARILVLLGGIN